VPRALVRATVVLLAALCAASACAGAAHAAPVPIAEGTVDWGFKASWRTYIGEAGITPAGGVARSADGGFTWPITGGSYDPDTRATELTLGGSVHFTAHDGLLDSTLSGGRVVISADATEIRFDIRSKTMEGERIELTDAPLAILDAESVAPALDGGRTRWSAIPTTITQEGHDAFTYGVGSALDPLSIDYAGPGGKPEFAETWTTPGTYAHALTSATELLPGVTWAPWIREAFLDEQAGVVHAIGYPSAAATTDHLMAIDADSGALLASTPALSGQRYAFDAERHTVFVGGPNPPGFSQELRAYTFDPEAKSYADQLLMSGVTGTVLTFDAATDTAALANSNGYVVLVARDAGGALTASRVDVAGMQYMSDFRLDGSGGALLTLNRNAERVLSIPDLGAAAPATTAVGGLTGQTYSLLSLGRGGEAWVTGLVGGSPRLQRIVRDGSGWSASGAPTTLPIYAAALTPSPDGSRIYGSFPFGNAIQVIEDGVVRGTIATDGPLQSNDASLRVAASDDGTVAVVHPHRTLARPGSVAVPWVLSRYALDAVSPAIGEQPADRVATLSEGEPSETVELTAAATATPAADVRWQVRSGGAGRFRDLPGATAATLTVEATRDDNGNQYRAVFSNRAGSIATEPATLTVAWAPRIGQQPQSVSVQEGEDALLKVMPVGNPQPHVTWQIRSGGFWRDLDPADGDVEISGEGGGFLTIKGATLDQSGARLRARVSNAVGTVFSDAVTLTVVPAVTGPVTFGGGHLDWGVANRWRCYVTGTIARGAIELAGGVERIPGTAATGALCPAAGAGSEALRFPVRGGSWDPASGRLEVRLGGSVRFWGHAHHVPGDTRPQLDTTISNLRIAVEGGRGTLYADTVGTTMENPVPVTRAGVELVTVDLAGVAATPAADGLGWSAIPSALTAAGSAVFGQYPVGEPFDPLTLSLVYGTPQTDPEPGPGPGDGGGDGGGGGGGDGGGGGGGTAPTGEQPPAGAPSATPRKARVLAASGVQRIGRARVARLATLACPAGAGRCAVTAPKRVKVRIGGRLFRAAVLAPKTVRAGKRGALRLRLPSAAAQRLRGRAVRVRVAVALRRGRQVTRKTVSVRIAAARAPR